MISLLGLGLKAEGNGMEGVEGRGGCRKDMKDA